MASKEPPKKKPPWAGQVGPGYVFDEDGELRLFESVSWMLGLPIDKPSNEDDKDDCGGGPTGSAR
jgi:hypothetical protein